MSLNTADGSGRECQGTAESSINQVSYCTTQGESRQCSCSLSYVPIFPASQKTLSWWTETTELLDLVWSLTSPRILTNDIMAYSLVIRILWIRSQQLPWHYLSPGSRQLRIHHEGTINWSPLTVDNVEAHVGKCFIFFNQEDKLSDASKGFLAITAPPGDPTECTTEQGVVVLLENNIFSLSCLIARPVVIGQGVMVLN